MEPKLEAILAAHIMQSLPLGILVTDSTGRPVWVNDTMRVLLDTTPGEQAADEHRLARSLQPFLEADGTFTVLHPREGSQLWLRHGTLGLPGTGEARQVHYYEDVTEAKIFQQERDQLAEKLRKQAPTDALTGLLTQHSLMQGLHPLVSLSRRYEKPLSIVLLEMGDIERHDGTGGLKVPEILVSISRLLKDQMRWADLIGRFGTYQFLLVLPETGKAAAAKLVEKIQPRLCQLDVPELPVHPVEMAATFGVTEWIKGDDAVRMVSRVYEALGAARRETGRICIL